MTVLRTGASKKYSENWAKAFGSSTKKSSKVTKKKTKAVKKKTRAKKK